jgi:hypothetical protein
MLQLEFLNSAGVDQFDVALRGLEQQLSILSEADTTGQDRSTSGFTSNATYLVVGKIAGNGSAANTLSASIFANGSAVGEFTSPSFPWMLTAQGSTGFNPLITQIQFTTFAEGNYTVSNVWIGDITTIPEPTTGTIVTVALAGLALPRFSGRNNQRARHAANKKPVRRRV